MVSVSSANQLFNVVFAMALAAVATLAANELRYPQEDGGQIQQEKYNSASAATASDPSNLQSANWSKLPVVVPQRIESTRTYAGAPEIVNVSDGQPAESNADGLADASSDTLAIAGAARAPAAPIVAKLASLPATTGVIFEELGSKSCIGGTLCDEHCKSEAGGCDVRPAYVIKLDQPAFLSALQLYAHDQVGPTRRAQLLVKVNGEAVGKPHVYRYGATLTVKIGRTAQLVSIEALHQRHGFLSGGEEAVIWDVYLFGRAPN
jgi:hypothetical protein